MSPARLQDGARQPGPAGADRRAGPGLGSEGAPGSPNYRRLLCACAPPLPRSARLIRSSRAPTVSFPQTTQHTKAGKVALVRLVTVTSDPRFSGCCGRWIAPTKETAAQCTTCTHAHTSGPPLLSVPSPALPSAPSPVGVFPTCLSTTSVTRLKHPGSVGEAVHELGGSMHCPAHLLPGPPCCAAASCDQGWAESLSREKQGVTA